MKNFFILFIFILSNNIAFSQINEEMESTPFYVNQEQEIWVDSIISSMSIDEKIGQLFQIDAFSNDRNSNKEVVENLIQKYHIGGVIFFKGNPVSQVKLTNHYQSISKVPLLIAMDAEWGVSMRLSKVKRLPMQMVIGATNNKSNSYSISDIIAKECKRLGVQMSYSPVADVNINPKNPIIGRRSFGENVNKVSEFSISSLNAYTDNGVLACAKHFPGHGDTSQDSHKTLPAVNASIERLEEVEFVPFRELINNKLPAVMVAHLRIPSLEPDTKLPSSLSPIIIDSLLKGDMNYKGLVLSDALNMKGASSFGSSVDVNIQAFKAGNDMLLYPLDIANTIEEFKKQIKNGDIEIDRINYSVSKILMAKYWSGLNNLREVQTKNLVRDLNTIESNSIIYEITKESFTLIKNENNTLPIIDVSKPIANVVFGKDSFKILNNSFNDYAVVDDFRINDSNFNSVKNSLNKYDKIIITLDNPFYKLRRNKSAFNKSLSKMQRQIDEISKNKDVILNLIGDPYSLLDLGNDANFDAILISYKNSNISQKYSASTIFGADSPTGVLPVSISDRYKEGMNLSYPIIGRLSYSTPELEDMDSNILSEIDSIVDVAILDSVMPGAQVLIARNGKIIYNKSFGYKTYKKKERINGNHLYDIASVTKIMATTPLVMSLVDKDELNLDSPIEQYLPELDTTSKAKITIREMMAHYAKLQPFIPFYSTTLDKKGYPDKEKYYSFNFDSEHNIKVSNNLYLRSDMKDSLFNEMFYSELRDTLEYKYSDLPYYFLKKIIETKEKRTLDKLVYKEFYKPLGLQRITYKPKNKFSTKSIVPSEKDEYFRQTILLGDVNDPGAAMLGGVGGHAGVFANSHDLAVMMQMYLQGGYYGGKRYFNESTLEEFTSCQYCDKGNRRGIGFDKPQLEGPGPACDCISYLSFGHSGYTGTMAWADPDEKIVYIFLSNRTFPSSKNTKLIDQNIRTNIQEIIYKSIKNE